MKPVPIVFDLGPLQVHTYGIGLAITFWFALVYTTRRLRAQGYPVDWMNRAFLWIVAAAIIGARVVHVIANIGFYSGHPGDIVAIWHGGLSSYGGLLFAVPTGFWFAKRKCPELFSWKGADFIAPVLMASWSMGRLLGPNFEINGGGLPTHAWYGLQYAGQAGYRIPVPIFQCLEAFGVFLVVLYVERWVRAHHGPTGLIFATMITLWDISRFFDEFAWLDVNPPWDAVEGISVALAIAGTAAMVVLLYRWRRQQARAAAGIEQAPPPVSEATATTTPADTTGPEVTTLT